MVTVETPAGITPRQFAKRVSRKKKTIYRWIERGWIKRIRLPSGYFLIPESEVERVLSGSAGQGQDGPNDGKDARKRKDAGRSAGVSGGSVRSGSTGCPHGDSGAPA